MITGRIHDVGVPHITRALENWAFQNEFGGVTLYLYGLGLEREWDFALSAQVMEQIPPTVLKFLQAKGYVIGTHEATQRVGDNRIPQPMSLGINMRYRSTREGLKKAYAVGKFVVMGLAGRIAKEEN